MTVFSFLIASFPRQLKRTHNYHYEAVPSRQNLKTKNEVHTTEFQMDFVRQPIEEELGIFVGESDFLID